MSDKTKELWQKVDVVCFDFDSTVVQGEGINELAEVCGVGAEVAALTSGAMNGSMLFEDALRMRLNCIKPKTSDLARCPVMVLTPGAKELFAMLHDKGVAVWIISGGFVRMIEPVAASLGVDREHIIANVLLFDEEGNYRDFDHECPTARTGGKLRAVQSIRANLPEDAVVALIGDGVTDLEARPACNLFIGFGGNVVRDRVKKEADWFVTSFAELMP